MIDKLPDLFTGAQWRKLKGTGAALEELIAAGKVKPLGNIEGGDRRFSKIPAPVAGWVKVTPDSTRLQVGPLKMIGPHVVNLDDNPQLSGWLHDPATPVVVETWSPTKAELERIGKNADMSLATLYPPKPPPSIQVDIAAEIDKGAGE